MAAAELGAVQIERPVALSGADPVARARALVPLLEASSPAIEAAKELTPEIRDALFDNGLLRLLLPREIGGLDIALPDFAEVCEAIAIGDASAAWGVCQGNVSAMSSAAYLAPEVVQALFGDRRAALAWGARHNRARAVVVPGGYRVTGTWDFASGNRHCTLLGAHMPVVHPDGSPRLSPEGKPEDVTVLFPRDQAKVTPEWNSLGLRGTGSDIYEVEDLFIPDAHACIRDRFELRRDRRPITAITSHLCYATGFSATALGVARGLLDRYVALARGKTARAGAQPMAENHGVQSEIAQLEASLRGGRMYLLGTAREVWAEAAAKGTLSMDSRIALRLATTTVMRSATDVSIACYRAGGTTAVLESNEFERRFRDAMSVSQHLQATPWHLETVGRWLLGSDQKPAFV
ncbi:acyl-CoA dehydrogenase family protein [Paracraurococcus lichenis]|uniref:Acyl-CoA dehydrogenase family protein n=1 Tax=Paracraurococcus lichenis TaxID=3064888 RepID=A0ABT9E0Z2_9PROT|nr:acyl-CoA dehydrogenase family protein [Paracraurococcus sp. LOR1-02]MDO9709775.1 acyl-CoA dehydrogenase family protein [Paracraurococcus sp. LOR1-02]